MATFEKCYYFALMKSNEDPNLFQLVGQFILFTKRNILVILCAALLGGAIGYFQSGLYNNYSLSRAILKVNLVPTNLVELILNKANETKGYSEAFNKKLISGSIENEPISDEVATFGWNNSDLLVLNYQTHSALTKAELQTEIESLTSKNKAIQSYFENQKALLEERLAKISTLAKKDTLEERRADHLRLIDIQITTTNTLKKPLFEILHFQTRTYNALELKPISVAVIGGVILGYIIVIIGLSIKTVGSQETE